MNLFSLKDQVILISGSSRGLGWAMAKAMVEAGATVILNGRDRELLSKRQSELEQAGFKAGVQAFDTADENQVLRSLQSIVEEYGQINGLVNNAAIQHRQTIQDFDLSDYDRLMDINLRGCFLLAREASRLMLVKGSGSILNIASIMGPQARKTISAYTTSKGGIVGLTKALAVELGPQGIRSNAIAPGFFATEMNTALVENAEFTSFIESRTPLQRWGQPYEIAGTAVFLMSAAASYINGHILTVDGGLSCQI